MDGLSNPVSSRVGSGVVAATGNGHNVTEESQQQPQGAATTTTTPTATVARQSTTFPPYTPFFPAPVVPTTAQIPSATAGSNAGSVGLQTPAPPLPLPPPVPAALPHHGQAQVCEQRSARHDRFSLPQEASIRTPIETDQGDMRTMSPSPQAAAATAAPVAFHRQTMHGPTAASGTVGVSVPSLPAAPRPNSSPASSSPPKDPPIHATQDPSPSLTSPKKPQQQNNQSLYANGCRTTPSSDDSAETSGTSLSSGEDDDRDDDYTDDPEASHDEDDDFELDDVREDEEDEEILVPQSRRPLRTRKRGRYDFIDDDDSSDDVVTRKRTRRARLISDDDFSDDQVGSTSLDDEDDDGDFVASSDSDYKPKRKGSRPPVSRSKKLTSQPFPAHGWRQSERQTNEINYRDYTLESSEEDPDGIIWTYEDEPQDQVEVDTIDQIVTFRSPGYVESDALPYEEREFMVKWKDRSHLHNTWEPYAQLIRTKGFGKLKNYIKALQEEQRLKAEFDGRDEYEQRVIEREMVFHMLEDMKQVERIVASREVPLSDENQSGVEYLCKWKRLFYDHCTWELGDMVQNAFQPEIDRFLERHASPKVPHRSINYWKDRPPFVRVKEQPEYLVGGKLRDYQLTGVNWMLYLWTKGSSGILADEMGLGKTVQTISTLSVLHNKYNVFGPFLVVVPLSVLHSWEREFAKWAPDMNVVVYAGNTKARAVIREHEFYAYTGKQPKVKFNVLLTTFELVLKDKGDLDPIRWAALAIDEAHRLKNQTSQKHEALREFQTAYRLLITGTPLQNTIRELWALISFLMPDEFQDIETFEFKYGAEGQSEQIQRLHERIKPFMLRRLKKDVEKSLPSKTERILRVELSPLQIHYYKNILTKNFGVLNQGLKAGNQLSLRNIAMELKKACNHPFLFPNAESHVKSRSEALKGLIMSSGKMVLLDKLLQRLKSDGHRVLIFSQMVRMLDILTDYATLRGYAFQRLDGSVPSEARKRSVEVFNAPGSKDFLFLLSTRAGGLGLNLETADTVIIFDSDWNPQNDLQAMARAHRIGQKKHVAVYRFISKETIEEDIIERAKRKRVLEYCIIQQMDTSGGHIVSGKIEPRQSTGKQNGDFSKDELNAILKFGAQNLFKETADKPKLDEMDLDDILSRAEASEAADAAALAEGGENFLAQFQVADYDGTKGLTWEDIIPEEERIKLEEQERLQEEELMNRRRAARITADFSDIPHANGDLARLKKGKKVRNTSARTTVSRKSKSKARSDQTTNLNEKEMRAALRALMKFGDPGRRLGHIIEDATLEEKDPKAVKKFLEDISSGSTQACKNPELKSVIVRGEPFSISRGSKVTLTFNKFRVNATDVNQRVEDLKALYDFLEAQKKKDLTKFRLGFELRTMNSWSVQWTPKDDSLLLVGIFRHGFGNWPKVRDDPGLQLHNKLFLEEDMFDKQPRQDHIERRAVYLLKMIREKAGTPQPPRTEPPRFKGRGTRNSMEIRQQDPIVEVTDIRQAFEPIQTNLQSIRSTRNEAEASKKVIIIQENLLQIGSHIAKLMKLPDKHADIDEDPMKLRWAGLKRMSRKERREVEQKLWSYVTTFWPSEQTWERIRELHQKMEKWGKEPLKRTKRQGKMVSSNRRTSDLEEGELASDDDSHYLGKGSSRTGSGASAISRKRRSPGLSTPLRNAVKNSYHRTAGELEGEDQDENWDEQSHLGGLSEGSLSSLSPAPTDLSDLEEGEYAPSRSKKKPRVQK